MVVTDNIRRYEQTARDGPELVPVMDLLEYRGRNQHWAQTRYWTDKKPINWTLGKLQYQDAAIEASARGLR